MAAPMKEVDVGGVPNADMANTESHDGDTKAIQTCCTVMGDEDNCD